MNPAHINNGGKIDPTQPIELDSSDIFLQMDALGIDPAYLLEIAAHDLLSQYGPDALTFSQQIEQDFRNARDPQSAAIWNKIAHYLENLNGAGDLVAH